MSAKNDPNRKVSSEDRDAEISRRVRAAMRGIKLSPLPPNPHPEYGAGLSHKELSRRLGEEAARNIMFNVKREQEEAAAAEKAKKS